MKIIGMGDFHGKFTKELLNKVKKEKPNITLCTGDLPDTSEIRKLTFKYWNYLQLGLSLEEIIGRKKYLNLEKKSLRSQEPILKKLNMIGSQVILIWGNSDQVNEKKTDMLGVPILNKRVEKYKNITLIKRERIIKFGEIQILAFSGYRYPLEKKLYENVKLTKKIIERNKAWKKRLLRMFKKREKNKTTILLTHDPPRGIMDVVKAENPLKGKQIGDEYFLEAIKKYKPEFHICGHMHEHPGIKKIISKEKKKKTIKGKQKEGKKERQNTTIINCGPAFENRFAIIEKNNKGKWYTKTKKI